ncbi:Uma2 family endonuclease [Limnoraphis robusta Tam1]|uniref:Uma2 family endonuclease n=1 Tax=Limnoraphis robusta CCNP1315 TaxID=3110306 RepID=A0ABU5TWA6_9CYAN|nr:Uma2 family endonuclease [Limnoraphis robusta]MEA5500257.1 Uma2 family endonuclease [Limnoraphis robusta BA-68 BA1]MEA5518248.1 Uma2 family endonuclease [Limnoraphis robusta CCNP1315]MEA5542277.1 Uma2 family endonuclease [Limnoraphis robusta Tam1]MEA5544071.1 Uma2 family endonuclease [Limnoraphis robusta CCNP1324]
MANPLKSQTILTSIPPLENGDRLTRPEFERRYNQMPNIKAELIEGVVYMASPLRHKQQVKPHSQIITWLGVYQAATAGIDLSIEPTVRLDLENEPQPDGVLLIEAEKGGKTQITEEGYLVGSPELIVEIAASSVSIDLGDKKRVYRRNGVQEYLVWQSYENQFNWFVLENGEYIQLQPDDAGIIRSRVFPGLWLAVNELLAGNMKQVLQVLQRGLESVEHQAFVEQLAQR